MIMSDFCVHCSGVKKVLIRYKIGDLKEEIISAPNILYMTQSFAKTEVWCDDCGLKYHVDSVNEPIENG